MYTVTYWFVTPNAVRRGTAMSKSPKEAFRNAMAKAEDTFVGCESIGVEGYTMWRDGKKIYSWCDLD